MVQVHRTVTYIERLKAFTGKAILVTSPEAIKGCEGVQAPNSLPTDARRGARRT